MKNSPGKIIVIRERRGFGCISSLVIISLFVYGFWYLCKQGWEEAETRYQREAAAEAKLTPEERRAKRCAPPNGAEVKSYFRGSIKKHLHDPSSYAPVETYGPSNHPNGYLYTQTYRAKNAFGATVLDECGLLCLTNTGDRVYKFLDRDALKALRDFLNASK